MSSNDLFSLGGLYDSGDDDDNSGDIVGDIVGDIYDAGDDDSDVGAIVGATLAALAKRGGLRAPARRVPQMRRPAPRAQLPQQYNPFSPKVEYSPFKPTKTRRFVMGFVGNVLASAVSTIQSQPQLPFRPERLVIPSTVGTNFALIDIKIGTKSQLAASGAVPALTFSEQSFGVDLGMDTAQISQTISFSVQNLDSGAPHVFQASLIGTAMDN